MNDKRELIRPFVEPELGPDRMICPERHFRDCWMDQTVLVDGRMTHTTRQMFGHDPDPHHTLVRELFTTINGTRWRNGLPQTVYIHLPLSLPQNQNHENMRSESSSESSEEEMVD